jgi:hypothetical protein
LPLANVDRHLLTKIEMATDNIFNTRGHGKSTPRKRSQIKLRVCSYVPMLSHIWAHIAKVTVKKVKVKRIKVKKVKVKKVQVKKVKVKKVKVKKVKVKKVKSKWRQTTSSTHADMENPRPSTEDENANAHNVCVNGD